MVDAEEKLWRDDEGHPDTWEVEDLLEKFYHESRMMDDFSSSWDRHGLTDNYSTPEWKRLCKRVHIITFTLIEAIERGRRQ